MLEVEYRGFLQSRNKPDTVETYIQYLRHISAYRYIADFISGDRVLEVGVLNGYGHNVIIRNAGFLVGFDLLLENVFKARELMKKKHVFRLLAADCCQLPFAKESFDSIVFFHVFEHLEKPQVFLDEALRVLSPGGKLFVTTPNRKLRLRPCQNPFPYQTEHVREYSPRQFRKALGNSFSSVKLTGLSSLKKEVLKSEKIRMQPRRNIFYAYSLYPFNRIIFTSIYQNFHKKRMQTVEALGNDFFSIEDFVFSDEGLASCIDMLAVCRK